MFAKDSSTISVDDQKYLDVVAGKLNGTPGANYTLVLEGYASAEGDATHNLVLANARAHAVANYLATNGKVDPARLHPVAYGPTGEPNDATNRRVDEIVVRLIGVHSSK